MLRPVQEVVKKVMNGKRFRFSGIHVKKHTHALPPSLSQGNILLPPISKPEENLAPECLIIAILSQKNTPRPASTSTPTRPMAPVRIPLDSFARGPTNPTRQKGCHPLASQTLPPPAAMPCLRARFSAFSFAVPMPATPPSWSSPSQGFLESPSMLPARK